jgi:sulfite exporter TauE/SafE
MCGGVAMAFSSAIPNSANNLNYHLAYNFGRISSYVLAGAIAGYLGSLGEARLDIAFPLLSFLSATFLLLMGLYIGQWWMGLSRLEMIGSYLWRYMGPLSKRFLPFKTPLHAYFYGGIWGWLPCGLVYSALVWSMSSGGAQQGALVMLFFGLGTLPALLATGIGSDLIKELLSNSTTRKILAFSLVFMSIYLIFNIIKRTT